MKTTYKTGLSLIFLNMLFVFTAKAQEKEPATAKQIIEGTVPGLKYGPKKIGTGPQNNQKEKNYKKGDAKTYLFNDSRKPQQGMKQASKQVTARTAAQNKLPSDAPEQTQKEEKKVQMPKVPMQTETAQP